MTKIVNALNIPAIAKEWVDVQIEKASRIGPFCEICTITPEIAKELLSRNPENRNASSSSINRLSESMKSGDFLMNGESIIVSEDGLLNDGQHRLMAVVEANAVIESVMVFGVRRDSRQTVDTGIKRTAGHVLAMHGAPSSDGVAAAIKVVLNYSTGTFLSAIRQSPQILAFYTAHPEIVESVRIGCAINKRIGGSPSFWSAAHFLASIINKEKADEFFDLLESGLGLTKGSPVFLLRMRMEKQAVSKAKLPSLEVFALTVKAFNAFVRGEEMKALRWADSANEDFPRFK